MTPEPARLTAVIVLYERAAADSEAFTSLQTILAENLEFGTRFQIVLYDNSPIAQDAPAIPVQNVSYVHDAENGALASAYNHALARAIENGSAWLLLLDQDTTLTADYVADLLTTIDADEDRSTIGAIVPLLELDGTIYSPESTFLYHLRHQIPHLRYHRASRETRGLQSKQLNAYNSGAAIRVSALQKIGGFPIDFRLDFLDHAIFEELHREGFFMYVLKSVLQQKLAHIDLNQVPLTRHISVLQSQSLFVARYGTLLDRLLFRLWLLRKSRDYRELCRDSRVWKGMVRQALGRWRLPAREFAR